MNILRFLLFTSMFAAAFIILYNVYGVFIKPKKKDEPKQNN